MEVNPWLAIDDDDDVDTVRALFESGAVDPNADRLATTSDGDPVPETLLSLAAGDGSADMVRMLILHGADVGRAAGDLVPLVRAVLLNRADTARVLLHGADPRSVWEGQPVLHPAAEGWDPANVTALLAFGADPNARDERGRTALHALAATAKGHLINEIEVGSVVAELLRHGADPSLVDMDGKSPRDLASWAAVRALLES